MDAADVARIRAEADRALSAAGYVCPGPTVYARMASACPTCGTKLKAIGMGGAVGSPRQVVIVLDVQNEAGGCEDCRTQLNG